MADYRKLIKFGTNSLIISLPKSWTNRNKLAAGDTLRVIMQDDALILAPGNHDGSAKEERSYTFAIDGDEQRIIKRKIFNAYLNNCDLITLTGKEIPAKNKQIRETIHQLMALELIEESANRMQAKCYLNMGDINIGNLTRKIDSIIKSMFQDILTQAKDPKKFEGLDITKNLSERDSDINRISFLIMRAIKHALDNPQLRKHYEQDGSLLGNWDLAQLLEKIGDILKRLSRIMASLDQAQAESTAAIIKELAGHYDDVMKAHHRKDLQALHQLALKRKDLTTMLDRYQEDHERTITIAKAVDSIKALFFRIDEITTIMD